MRICSGLLVFTLASTVSAQKPQTTPAPQRINKSTPLRTADAAMAARVRQEFLHAWNGYRQYAWGHDELKPLSKSYRDWGSAPLLMTPVDALDTMLLMGLNDEADRTRKLIAEKLSFDHNMEE